MKWISVPTPDGKKIPEWARSIGVSERGQVFVPAGMGGKESEVVLCLMYDGVDSHLYLNHSFVPADWMAKEFPATRELCEKMVMAAQAAIRDGIV